MASIEKALRVRKKVVTYLKARTPEAKREAAKEIIKEFRRIEPVVKPEVKPEVKPKPPKPKKIFEPPVTFREKILQVARLTKEYKTYEKTGVVPEGIEIPPEIKELGKEAEKAYVKASIDLSIGLKPKERIEKELSQVMEREFKKLPPEKQEEYGYKYTEWEKIPIHERKYYPGAKKHFAEYTEEQKTEVFKEYVKRKPGLKLLVEAGYKVEEWSPEMRELVWESVTTPYKELERKRYEKLPLWRRTLEAMTWGAATAFTAPVLIAEEVAKRVTKYKPVGAKALAYVQRAPPGLISATIEEGIAKVTKQRSEAYQRMARYPVEAVGATVGEIAGLWMLGKGIKAVGRGIKEITKSTIRTIPKITRVIRGYRPVRITRVEVGKEAVSTLQRITRKPIFKDIQAWARGEKVFVRRFPLKKVKVFEPKKPLPPDVGVYIKKAVYKGIGKRVLVPKEMPVARMGRTAELVLKKVYEAPGVGRKILAAHMKKLSAKGMFYKKIEKTYVTLTKEWKWGRRYYPPPEVPPPPKYIIGRPPVTIAVQRYIPVGMKNLWRSQQATMSLLRHKVETVRQISERGVGMLGRGAEAFVYVPYTIPTVLPTITIFGMGRTLAGVQTQQQRLARLSVRLSKVGVKEIHKNVIDVMEDTWRDRGHDVDRMLKKIYTPAITPVYKTVTVYKEIPEEIIKPLPAEIVTPPKFKFPFIFPFPDEKEIKRKLRVPLPEVYGIRYYYREFAIPKLREIEKRIAKIWR